jgi:tRNA threonylcarbamoyladenosine biosynthesis protein TsaB
VNTAPVILSLETATIGGSICVARGDKLLATREGDAKVSHSNSLLSDINDCLQKCGLKLADVELFACASGPGSFTGLRIGIATLKALSATLDRPCAAVPSLNAIAQGAGQSNATVALLPAGRGEVFAQMFSVSVGELVELDAAAHLSPAKTIARYQGTPNLVWTGPGAIVHRALLQDYAGQHGITFGERTPQTSVDPNGWEIAQTRGPVAQYVSLLALRLFMTGQVETAESLHAKYVRPSDAEINQAWQ